MSLYKDTAPSKPNITKTTPKPAAPAKPKHKDHDTTIVVVPVGGSTAHHSDDDLSGGEIAAVVICSLLLAVLSAWVIWFTRDSYKVNKSH